MVMQSTGSAEDEGFDSSDDEEVPKEDELVQRQPKRKRVAPPLPPPQSRAPAQPQSISTQCYGQLGWSWMPGASQAPPMWLSGMAAAFLGTQGAVEATPLSQDSEDRLSRRKRRNAYEKQSRQWTVAGAKPNCVYVLPGGEVDGESKGKNAWDEAIRELVPKIMDMSVVEWSKHPPHRVKKLKDALDSEFEYVGNPLSMAGFRAAITRLMKSKRSRLRLGTSRMKKPFQHTSIPTNGSG